ncbi:MAG TPA: STAS domain-containing protein [Mycobacteriales bacterium]|nr:STAS domain-containing protein [Mycobacteriales bacterium]
MSVPAGITVDVRAVDAGVVELVVAGEVDLASAPVLNAAIKRAADEPGVAVLRVALAEVTFLDSVGLSVLVAGRNLAEERGLTFAVRHPSRQAHKVLGLTGLLEVLGVDPDEKPAGL